MHLFQSALRQYSVVITQHNFNFLTDVISVIVDMSTLQEKMVVAGPGQLPQARRLELRGFKIAV